LLFFWLSCALAIALVAGALLFQARRIRARHRRFLTAPAPSASPGATRLVDAPRALYHGTAFADGTALLAPPWREACVCDLWCTEEALFVQLEANAGAPGALLAIELLSVEEAALHRAHAPLAGKELPMLRLRWKRGGELLQTGLSLRGGSASLETLRREIHLRQGNIAAQLARFIQEPASPASPVAEAEGPQHPTEEPALPASPVAEAEGPQNPKPRTPP
jgi:hypothetical protein